MKIRNYLLALLPVLALAACNQQPAPPAEPAADEPVALDSTEQRLSYGIAFGLGQRIKADGIPVQVEAFSEGFRHGFEGTTPRLTQEEIGREMQAYQASRQAGQDAALQEAAAANAAAGAAFVAAYAQQEGVVALESGLHYKVLEAGDGPMPGPDDTVEVNYRGTLITGEEFDSSYSRGSSVSFGVSQVIPGWTEALQLMPAGSRWELVIPADLAYGVGGAGNMIGPNATLVFEVDLIQVKPKDAP